MEGYNLYHTDENFRVPKDYAQKTTKVCKKHTNTFWINYTEGEKDIPHTHRQFQETENLRTLVGQLANNEDDFIPFRHKRGVFNYIEGIAKILLGILDNEDANYDSDKINSL
jgi:hypothetical protein